MWSRVHHPIHIHLLWPVALLCQMPLQTDISTTTLLLCVCIWCNTIVCSLLPSLFAAWLFWTFHNKSHNMKVISHSTSFMFTISPTYLFIWKKWTFVGLCMAFWSIFLRKKSFQITHANHMSMTTSGQIWSWPDYHKTKENVNIKLLGLCLFKFYSVHANESTWHWL